MGKCKTKPVTRGGGQKEMEKRMQYHRHLNEEAKMFAQFNKEEMEINRKDANRKGTPQSEKNSRPWGY